MAENRKEGVVSRKVKKTVLPDPCAFCVIDGKSTGEARKCDAVHYHQFCGAKVILAPKKGLTCESGHPEKTILKWIVKTKEELDYSRSWD